VLYVDTAFFDVEASFALFLCFYAEDDALIGFLGVLVLCYAEGDVFPGYFEEFAWSASGEVEDADECLVSEVVCLFHHLAYVIGLYDVFYIAS